MTVAKPDVAKPNVVKTDVVKPDVPKPDVAKPDVVKPDVAKTDISKPDVSKPDVAKPFCLAFMKCFLSIFSCFLAMLSIIAPCFAIFQCEFNTPNLEMLSHQKSFIIEGYGTNTFIYLIRMHGIQMQ